MDFRKLVMATIAGALLVPSLAAAQKGEGDYQMIVNSKGLLNWTLSSQEGETRVRGRVSVLLQASPEEIAQGIIPVRGFNVAFVNVPQILLTGRKSEDERGAVGFAADSEQQSLRYDANRGVLFGEIRGQVDIAQIAAETTANFDEEKDVVEVPTQFATLAVELELEKPFDLQANEQEISRLASKIKMDMIAEPDSRFGTLDYRLELLPSSVVTEYVPMFYWEGVRRLCVQPVRVASFSYSWPNGFNIHYSGDGLAYGQPGAQTQWAKADVAFQYRPWKTLYFANYLTLSESEAASLRAKVQDDDCVEVFFVDQLSPNAMWGGGATWGSGTATTQIISSDQNADFGLDATHLAHELGHAIALKHPGSGGTKAGSSGTLMCPSGFMNDNPAVQSVENENNVSNPLFTYGWKLLSPGPDCNASADCGPC